MKTQYDIAAGSIIGFDHRQPGKNNQDAFCWFQNEQVTIAVTCDGCSSGLHNEIGSQIGSKILVNLLANQVIRIVQPVTKDIIRKLLERVRLDALAYLRLVALAMGSSFTQTVTDYFLFTTIGFVIDRQHTFTFSLGDGVIIVNGDLRQVGPFANNEPPYLAYGLVNSKLSSSQPELLGFQVHHILETDELQTMLIGSDGLLDLLRFAKHNSPGLEKQAGPVSQFWTVDDYFHNPDAIRRKLFLINRDSIKPDWEQRRLIKSKGLLADDTTLVVIRKRVT